MHASHYMLAVVTTDDMRAPHLCISFNLCNSPLATPAFCLSLTPLVTLLLGSGLRRQSAFVIRHPEGQAAAQQERHPNFSFHPRD